MTEVNDDFGIEPNSNDTIQKLTPGNIMEINASIPAEFGKTLKNLRNASRELKTAMRSFDSTVAKLHHEMKFNGKFHLNKGEIEVEMCKDNLWQDAKQLVDDAQIEFDYYKGRMESIRQIGFAVKSYVEYQKFINGEF